MSSLHISWVYHGKCQWYTTIHNRIKINSLFNPPWPYRLGWPCQELKLPPASLSVSWGVLGPLTTLRWQTFERAFLCGLSDFLLWRPATLTTDLWRQDTEMIKNIWEDGGLLWVHIYNFKHRGTWLIAWTQWEPSRFQELTFPLDMCTN
jgi:hypothetical protein